MKETRNEHFRKQSGGRTLRRYGRACYQAQIDEMLARHVLPPLPEWGHAPALASHVRALRLQPTLPGGSDAVCTHVRVCEHV